MAADGADDRAALRRVEMAHQRFERPEHLSRVLNVKQIFELRRDVREDGRSGVLIQKIRLAEAKQDFSDMFLRGEIAARQEDAFERMELRGGVTASTALDVQVWIQSVFERA